MIEPRILKGTRDLLPETMQIRQYVIGVLKEIFERFGFEPLETPAIEYAETFEGKSDEETDKLIYKFKDRGNRRIALRYELNVALARVIAMYPELVKPFKRYQMGPVWRADKPQKGRYRELWQCDIDSVGTSSMLADAELIIIVYEALTRLGFEHFTIKINNRKILSSLAQYVGVPETQSGNIYRAIDKLEKIGAEGVRAELINTGLNETISDRLLDLVQEKGDNEKLIAEMKEKLVGFPKGLEGVIELEGIINYLEDAEVSDKYYQIDLSMVRGLGYYTGPIFETVVEKPKIGSLGGGGRYDNLVGIFSKQNYPATGYSFGLERIIDVIEELNMIPSSVGKTITQALVTTFDSGLAGASLNLANKLRDKGIRTEMYLKENDNLGKQFRYADRKGIPYVLILGPDEKREGSVTVKDMKSGEQISLSEDKVADFINNKLSSV